MLGNACPNCIDSGSISLSLVLLTLGVTISGWADKFKMIRSRQCSLGTTAMWNILIISPNICTKYASERIILKSSSNLCCISLWMNSTIYGLHAYAWGPFLWCSPGPPSTRAVLCRTGCPTLRRILEGHPPDEVLP